MNAFLPRRRLAWSARFLVALLLFAQGVMIAHACTAAQRGAAFAAAAEPASAAPCHEADAQAHAAAPGSDSASCISHCSSADQSAATFQVLVHAMPAVALLTLPAAAAAPGLNSARAAVPPPTGDPPIAIRFQVFRI